MIVPSASGHQQALGSAEPRGLNRLPTSFRKLRFGPDLVFGDPVRLLGGQILNRPARAGDEGRCVPAVLVLDCVTLSSVGFQGESGPVTAALVALSAK